MKIKRSESYSIELYEEPHKISNHHRSSNGTLTFTGAELIEAIVSAGMPDAYLTRDVKRNRREEIEFKIKLFETYVVSSKAGVLSFDTSRKKYLDATEVGAINYWIGMMLVTVLGQKKYDYEFMVHLSMIESFSSEIKLKKRAFFSANGKITFKSPDLLAINSSKNMYAVFESKGYSSYSKIAMERGYTQAKSIKRINGNPPKNRLVAMVLIGSKKISIIEKDPEGDNCEININLNFLYLYHFLPIVELIMELGPEKHGDRMRAYLRYGDDCYSISIPVDLYKEFSQIVKTDKEPFSDGSVTEAFFSEIHFSQLITEKSEKRILYVE